MSDEKCTTCQRKPNALWECTHLECPCRKPVTAAAPSDLDEDGRRPALINDNH